MDHAYLPNLILLHSIGKCSITGFACTQLHHRLSSLQRLPLANTPPPPSLEHLASNAYIVQHWTHPAISCVQVDRYVPHKLYGKRVRVTKKFFAHDEEDVCTVGDVVEMTSIPPKSKRKTFKIHKIVTKSDF